jgi:hypothetical protein
MKELLVSPFAKEIDYENAVVRVVCSGRDPQRHRGLGGPGPISE